MLDKQREVKGVLIDKLLEQKLLQFYCSPRKYRNAVAKQHVNAVPFGFCSYYGQLWTKLFTTGEGAFFSTLPDFAVDWCLQQI